MSKTLICTGRLHDFAAQQLGDLAATACLPLELLEKYSRLYPEGLVCAQIDGELHGFFLLVPVTEFQSNQLLSGTIKNGFELSASQESQRPAGFREGLNDYYLMGIYADMIGRKLIKEQFEETVSSFEKPAKIFAKGTTEKGKNWMCKRGFVRVNQESPISVLFT